MAPTGSDDWISEAPERLGAAAGDAFPSGPVTSPGGELPLQKGGGAAASTGIGALSDLSRGGPTGCNSSCKAKGAASTKVYRGQPTQANARSLTDPAIHCRKFLKLG